MAGSFSNRKALKLLAGAVYDKMDYIKASESLFSQEMMKGAKYGKAVHGYLADPGSVYDGIVADPKPVVEVEVTGYVKNKGTAVETDMFDELLEIEDFKKEIYEPRANKLARETQIDIIGENVYRSAQAVVTSTLGTKFIADASSKLSEMSLDGKRVEFQTPQVYSDIGDVALKLFLPSEIASKIYGERALGTYNLADQVQLPLLPVLNTTGASTAPTISATVVKDASNNIIGLKPINTITHGGSGALKVGVPYKVTGLKIVDPSGVETFQDFIVIPNKEVRYNESGVAETVTYIPEIRLTVDGKGFGNPNAHMDADTLGAAVSDTTATFTLEPIVTIGKTYQVGQCRLEKALKFDQYRFETLKAAQADSVGTFKNITLKMQSAPQIINGVNCYRIDMPYVAKVFEIRESVTTYLQLD